MNEISFSTKISEEGTILLPNEIHLNGKTVLVTIQLKDTKSINDAKIERFLNKWSGFLNNTSTEDAKYDYLMEKYK